MNMDAAFQTFIEESRELLQAMEDHLVGIEAASDPKDSIDSIFRAIHTIKGSAGLFGLDAVVGFAHVAESVLDRVRSDAVNLDDVLTSLLLHAKDFIGRMIDSIDNGKEVLNDDDRDRERDLSQRLFAYLDPDKAQAPTHASTPQTLGASVEATGGGLVDNDNWHISIRFYPNALRNGMDPLSFIRYLGTLGKIVHITSLYQAMPAAGEMDPESCYMAYEINFESDADKATIENVFEFVQDDCELHIVPPHGRITDFLKIIEGLPSDELRLGDILVRSGTLTQKDLEKILAIQRASCTSTKKRPLGEIAVNEGLVQPIVVEAALQKQEQNRKDKDKQQSIRVDAGKLDHLINLIGELVIAGAGIETEVRNSGLGSLSEASLTMTRLIEEVRDGALNLRMVQIGDTFNRFQRVVRDVSKELGKEIELQIFGGDTELDKTVVEKIGDPLTHLVRNSIDHGIESPDTRAQCGKPAVGTVCLNAYHESGSIVIEVTDDGAGLNREKILRKAVEKGLIEAGEHLPDQEVYKLIFEAGFSTADQVSNLSGRGVGMDVVRRNIEALRGSIELDSQLGVGTTTRIRLPLTLAIIDGFLMGVGSASYVVPLELVVECIELTDVERASGQGRNFINLRGEVLPFIRLREHFREAGKPGKRENIVVVQYGNKKAGLVVDALMGEFQTVIKPLGSLFGNLKGISGSTILGSGEVALILDAPALVNQAMEQKSHPAATEMLAVGSK